MKQGTIEESAENFANSKEWMNGGASNWVQYTFTEGGKSDAARDYWFKIFQDQDKNNYREEEVLELLKKSHFVEQNIEEWFEQFSKRKNES
jgi:hypothetical protein